MIDSRSLTDEYLSLWPEGSLEVKKDELFQNCQNFETAATRVLAFAALRRFLSIKKRVKCKIGLK